MDTPRALTVKEYLEAMRTGVKEGPGVQGVSRGPTPAHRAPDKRTELNQEQLDARHNSQGNEAGPSAGDPTSPSSRVRTRRRRGGGPLREAVGQGDTETATTSSSLLGSRVAGPTPALSLVAGRSSTASPQTSQGGSSTGSLPPLLDGRFGSPVPLGLAPRLSPSREGPRTMSLAEYTRAKRHPSAPSSVAPSQSVSQLTGMSQQTVLDLMADLKLTLNEVAELRRVQQEQADTNRDIRAMLLELTKSSKK